MFGENKGKYFIIIIALLVIIATIFLIFNNSECILEIQGNQIKLIYKYQGKISEINGQELINSNEIHIFAPRHFDLKHIVIKNDNENTNNEIKMNEINNQIIYDNGKNRIIIHKLTNESLFIDLDSEYTYDDIKADKNLKVPSHIINIDINGKVVFNGKAKFIKGRGNSSWWGGDKKPLAIVFDNQTSLANLPYTNRYTLINQTDDLTGIRNKFIYDLANDIGLEYSPKTSFVNVYIDGNYEGLYLLSGRLSVDNSITSNKENDRNLEIVTENIGELKEIKYFKNNKTSKSKKYLIERDYRDRYNEDVDKAGFITKQGNCYLLHYSQEMTYDEVKLVANKVQQLDNALYAKNDNTYLGMIDLESWAKQFLIEMVGQNYDAYVTSSFMYYDINEDLFYGGPVWDFDSSIGHAFTFQLDPHGANIFDSVLANKKELIENVKDKFNELIYPKKEELINIRTHELANQIKNDMYLNVLRFNTKTSIRPIKFENYSYEKEFAKLQSHLRERIEYINKVLNDDAVYCRVIFNSNIEYGPSKGIYLVKYGDLFTNEHKTPYFSNENDFPWPNPLWISKWVDKDGKEFDFTKPITEDIELYAVWEGDTDAGCLKK